MASKSKKTVAVKLTLDNRAFRKGLTRSKRLMKSFAADVQGLARSVAIGGAAISGVVGTMMVKSFVDFEFQMKKVKSMSGATGKEFAALTAKAKQVGAATQKTASEVGSMQFELAKLGYTASQIDDMTDSITNLGISIDEDLGQAAIQVASVLRQFNLGVRQTGDVSDQMAYAFSSSGLDLEKFSESIKYSGKTAQAAGWQYHDLLSNLATAANSMQIGSMAGTAMRRMLIDLAKSGMSWDDALQEIRDSTDKLTTAEEIFGVKSATIALVLADNTDQTAKYSEELLKAGGQTKWMAGVLTNSAKGAIDLATSAFNTLRIEVGSKLFASLMPVIQEFKRWSNEVNPELLAGLLKFIAAISGGAGLIWALGSVTGKIAPLITGLYQLGSVIIGTAIKAILAMIVSLGAWGAVITLASLAIAGLGIAVAKADGDLEGLGGWFDESANDIASFIEDITINLKRAVMEGVEFIRYFTKSAFNLTQKFYRDIKTLFSSDTIDEFSKNRKKYNKSQEDEEQRHADKMTQIIKDWAEEQFVEPKIFQGDSFIESVKTAAETAGKTIKDFLGEAYADFEEFLKKLGGAGYKGGGDGSAPKTPIDPGLQKMTRRNGRKAKGTGLSGLSERGGTSPTVFSPLSMIESNLQNFGDNVGDWAQDFLEKWGMAINAVSDIWNAMFDMIAERNRQRVEDIEISRDKQLESVDMMALSEEEKEKKRVKINEKADREIAKMKLKAWKAEQRASIGNAIMNTALGVTQALAQGGIAGIVTGAIVAAAGGMQIAAIAGQRPPQFAEGGIVSGRTLAEVGEYTGVTSNPEVIAPLDKLKSMIGTGAREIYITGEFVQRGSDLVAVVDKSRNRRSRY